MDKLKKKFSFSLVYLSAFIILLCAIMAILTPSFLTKINLRNILNHSAPYIIMSLGMTAVIASRGIDLSIGSNVALSGVIVALLLKNDVAVGPAIFLTLFFGAIMGGANGLLITKFPFPPYVVTLTTMSIYRGLTLVLTKGQTIYGFPEAFVFLGKGSYGQLNFSIVISILLAFIFIYTFPNTKWGQYAKALGSNESALERRGVNTNLYKISIYMVMGILAAFSGCIFTSRIQAADPGLAYMLETDVIAAVILGGTHMRGGKSSMTGSVLASILLVMIRNALTHLSVSAYYHQLTTGIILLISIILSEYSQQLSKKQILGGKK